MGWFSGEDADEETWEHEGYVQGVVRDGFGWRDLGLDDVRDDTRLMQVQVACSCGWRSRRYTPPLGTDWAPCAVFFPDEEGEDAACAIWQEQHRDHLGTRGDLADLRRALLFGHPTKVAP